MTIATRAFTEFCLASSKVRIEEMIMVAAKQEKRLIEIPCLPCQKEHIPVLVAWLQTEGLTVEHKKWMDKPIGFGAGDDDEEVEYSKWVVSF
jgi:hypothetical protein